MAEPALPPGFTVDETPPPGFTLDQPDAPDTKQELPGFSDEQKQQILDYLPKAKDAADLERFSSELTQGRSKIGNAQSVLDARDKGHKQFGWTPPTPAAPTKAPEQSTAEHLRGAVGEGILNALDTFVPGLGDILRQHQGAGKAFTEHAANAVAADYGPEVGGLIDTIIHPGSSLDRNVAHERAIISGDSEDHGVASTLGELTGVGADAMLGNEAGLANLGRGTRLVATAGEGAAYGSGAAGPGNRVEGGAIGAVAAPVIGLAAKVPAALIGAGKSVMEGTPGLARRIISSAIKQDMNTPESVGATIAGAHANDVPMALGDTGENMRGLLAASSRASGVGRTVVRDALEERQSQLADRITGHIERDLGPVANPHQVADNLMTEARTKAAPIYDQFYSKPPVASTAVDTLLQRPSMQKALKNAYTLAKEEGRDPESLGLRIGEDGKVVLESGQTLSSEEAAKANPSRFADVAAPDEMKELGVRTITTNSGRKVKVRGPLDITQSLRLMGGVRDDGGDMTHLGISNAPRRMPFGSNEHFLGNLINPHGVSLDEAAEKLWEEGYFPEATSRPTVQDLLDKLHAESTGAERYFHPDTYGEVADFNRAQSQRYGLDEKATAGSPVATDRTYPATMMQDLINREGPAGGERRPLVRNTYTPQTLDYIKRGMDDVVEGYRDPTSGKLNLDTEGRAVNNTLRAYMGVVDKLYPDYAAARAAYAGPVKGVAALNVGRKFLNMTADDIEARMRDMSPFEKQMAAAGTRRAMAEMVQAKGDTADIVNALVGTGKKRAMLGRLFGDRKQFQRFVDTLGQEREGWRSFKQALLGSPTAANAQDDSALQTATIAADLMTTGLPVATSMRYALKFGVGKLGEKAKQQVAALLSNTDPAAIRELAAELRTKAEQRGVRVRRLNNITGTIGKGSVALMGQQQAQ